MNISVYKKIRERMTEEVTRKGKKGMKKEWISILKMKQWRNTRRRAMKERLSLRHEWKINKKERRRWMKQERNGETISKEEKVEF